jgi:hypothetical protein
MMKREIVDSNNVRKNNACEPVEHFYRNGTNMLVAQRVKCQFVEAASELSYDDQHPVEATVI